MIKRIYQLYWFVLTTSLFFLSSGLNARTFNLDEVKQQTEELTADGPYIIHQPDNKIRFIRVNRLGEITDTIINNVSDDFCFEVTDHKGDYHFNVRLHSTERPEYKYDKADETFVLSDPHGRLDCFISLLQGNNIIDDNYNWTFGNNHLVIIGDVFDRGKDVLSIFWLIYKLEDEARRSGGRVSLLLGNHEAMILGNNLKYTDNKYKQLAKHLDINYCDLFGPDTELGRWLSTRNTMQIIGKDVYVHAGLGQIFYQKGIDIPTVNKTISKYLFYHYKERKKLSPTLKFLFGNNGPLWYRGLVREDARYNPLSKDTLNLILNDLHCKHIIVGHTIFDDISTFYKDKVIGVNVDNKENMDKGLGRALLIRKNKYYIVGDNGILRKLF